MYSSPVNPIRSVTSQAQAARMQKLKANLQTLANRQLRQVLSKAQFAAYCRSGFNPVTLSRKFKTFEEFKPSKKEKSEVKKEEEGDEIVEDVTQADETASRFQRDNPELKEDILLLLRSNIRDEDTPEEILKKVLELFPDFTLADEALDYLLETTKELLHERVSIAKQMLNTQYEREIKAGKNIKEPVKEYSQTDIGTPSSLRDLYRDITGERREPQVLFDELTKQYTFEELKNVFGFLFHALGADLKAKGPSIPKGELYKLINDSKDLQAILGVYWFFLSRMNLINNQFSYQGLELPSILTFEELAKQFMKLISERYLSPEKITQAGRALGIEEEIIAQIIIFTQMRDGMRQTAPRLFKSEKKRQEILAALLEALEELEEEADEREDEDDDDDDGNDEE